MPADLSLDTASPAASVLSDTAGEVYTL